MMLMTMEQIIEASKGKLIQSGEVSDLKGISTDTRTLEEGQLFIPLIGESFNGHLFIKQAKEKGACGILYSKGQVIELDALQGLYIIEVEDTLTALKDISTFYKNLFKIPFVAVTGSTGKTTTKDLISSTLAAEHQVLKNYGNLNNQIGLPLTLFNLEKKHEIAVLEMGMSSFGEIKSLVEIVKPNVAVITNIGMSHIEHLGSQENILKAKMEITSFLTPSDYLLLNGDDPFLNGLKQQECQYHRVFYGLDKKNDFYPEQVIDKGAEGFSIHMSIMGRSFEFTLHYPGLHNVYNALAAIWTGLHYGMSPEAIQRGLGSYIPSKMRMEVHEKEGITLINDAYNASPDSMKAALKVLNDWQGVRKIAVLGNIFELGTFSEEGHRGVGAFAAETDVDVLIAVGDMAAWISDEVKQRNATDKMIFSVKDNTEAIELLKELVKNQDIILIKGSRGMKMEEIVNYLLERS